MKSFDCQKTSAIISDENVESQYHKDVSIISIQSRSVQRSQSENTPLFHDSSSGRLVKLENFSFDSAPNHFHIQSEDYLECDKRENGRFHSGKMGTLNKAIKQRSSLITSPLTQLVQLYLKFLQLNLMATNLLRGNWPLKYSDQQKATVIL